MELLNKHEVLEMIDSYSKLKGKEPLKINLIPPDILF